MASGMMDVFIVSPGDPGGWWQSKGSLNSRETEPWNNFATTMGCVHNLHRRALHRMSMPIYGICSHMVCRYKSCFDTYGLNHMLKT